MAETDMSFAARFVVRWRALSPGTKDAGFAVVVTFITQVELLLLDEVEGSMLAQSLSFAVMTLSMAWRRTRPVVASALVGGGLAVQTVVGEAEVAGGFIALLVVMYSVASFSERGTAIVAGLFVMAGVFTFPLVNETNFADEAGNLAIFVGLWALGRAVRSWRQGATEAERRATAIERDGEEKMQAALADERGRIARELHDIVAHGVSVMVLQAGAARQLLDRDADRAEEPLLIVENMGREALDEMRRLLGVLRRSDDDLALAPPLTLSAIDQLIDDVRQTGLAVESRVEGNQRPLASGLEVSAYRIVQEALTNTIKHAEASAAEVVLRYSDNGLELTVSDNGLGPTDSATSGHGLVGMQERAQLFNGTVTAGPGELTGWVVKARLSSLEDS